jgi:hypothetical protein
MAIMREENFDIEWLYARKRCIERREGERKRERERYNTIMRKMHEMKQEKLN